MQIYIPELSKPAYKIYVRLYFCVLCYVPVLVKESLHWSHAARD